MEIPYAKNIPPIHDDEHDEDGPFLRDWLVLCIRFK